MSANQNVNLHERYIGLVLEFYNIILYPIYFTIAYIL